MPSKSSSRPKVNRGTPWIASSPTNATSMPSQPAIQPLSGISPAVIEPQIEMPITASRNISQDLKLSAKRRNSGMKPISSTMPTQLPTNEAAIAMPSAWPPSPRMASGWPSSMIGTSSGVPGMLIRTAETAPPNTLPV